MKVLLHDLLKSAKNTLVKINVGFLVLRGFRCFSKNDSALDSKPG